MSAAATWLEGPYLALLGPGCRCLLLGGMSAFEKFKGNVGDVDVKRAVR